MAAKHPAARLEDAVHSVLAAGLERRGWTPRVLPYAGYGGEDFARVMCRVVLGRPGDAHLERPDRRGYNDFLAAPVADTEVTVTLGAARVSTTVDRGGYLDIDLTGHGLAPGWQHADIAVAGASVSAPVQIIGSDVRFGIISDIDDTCLVTMLPRLLVAAWNTFVREEAARRVVPGMASMYQAWLASRPGSPIFYVSTGAWNTQPTLARFFRRHAFPRGPMLLTDWGPTPDRFFRDGAEHKRQSMRRLAREFPHIRWRLVGDDGQRDKVLYEEFAQEHPRSVEVIAIRQLTPAEQVLSHGLPTSRADPQQEADVIRAEGPDGFALYRLVHQAQQPTTTEDRAHA